MVYDTTTKLRGKSSGYLLFSKAFNKNKRLQAIC